MTVSVPENSPSLELIPIDRRRDSILFGNDGSNIGNNADIIMTYNAQRNRILRTDRLTSPTRFNNPVSETLAHLIGIRTVCPVNLDTSAHGHKSEYIISIDRITAFGQFKFQSFQILIDDKYILFELGSS